MLAAALRPRAPSALGAATLSCHCALRGASQEFLNAVKTAMGMTADDPRDLFILHLVLLPVLQAACDGQVRVRHHRNIQGVKGGVPLARADASPRPPELHRPVPEGTVDDFVAGFVAAGFGQLSTQATESKVLPTEDKLAAYFSGVAAGTLLQRRVGTLSRRARASRLRRAGQALFDAQAWRAACLGADVEARLQAAVAHWQAAGESILVRTPMELLWSHIHKRKKYDEVFAVLDLARELTDELCAAAWVLGGHASWDEYVGSAPTARSRSIRDAIRAQTFTM
jgi:hypothetical protein